MPKPKPEIKWWMKPIVWLLDIVLGPGEPSNEDLRLQAVEAHIAELANLGLAAELVAALEARVKQLKRTRQENALAGMKVALSQRRPTAGSATQSQKSIAENIAIWDAELVEFEMELLGIPPLPKPGARVSVSGGMRPDAIDTLLDGSFSLRTQARTEDSVRMLRRARELLLTLKDSPTSAELKSEKMLLVYGGSRPTSVDDWFKSRAILIQSGLRESLTVRNPDQLTSEDRLDLAENPLALEDQCELQGTSWKPSDSEPKPNLVVSNFQTQFDALKDVLWTEDFSSQHPLPIEYNDGLVVFNRPGVTQAIVNISDISLKMAKNLAVSACLKSDGAYQKQTDRLFRLTLTVYKLLVANFWDLVRGSTNAETASLMADIMLLPLSVYPGHDVEFQAYLAIDPEKTGPGDRAFECCKYLAAQLSEENAEMDVASTYMVVAPEVLTHRSAAAKFVEVCFHPP